MGCNTGDKNETISDHSDDGDEGRGDGWIESKC